MKFITKEQVGNLNFELSRPLQNHRNVRAYYFFLFLLILCLLSFSSPQAAQISLFGGGKSLSIAPPRGTWLRTRHWMIEKLDAQRNRTRIIETRCRRSTACATTTARLILSYESTKFGQSAILKDTSYRIWFRNAKVEIFIFSGWFQAMESLFNPDHPPATEHF